MNDCINENTFKLYERFMESPHVVGGLMYPHDIEEYEVVEITLHHYQDVITVVFNTETEIGEVLLHLMGNSYEEDQTHFMGWITSEKLADLLWQLPHIADFMEEEIGERELH